MTYTIIKAGVAPSIRTLLRRDADGAFIPDDAGNMDWREYQAWLQAGNMPTEVDESVTPSSPTPAASRSAT